MARQRNPIPSYLPHTQTGRARAVWTDQTGRRRFQMLPGSYDSPESRTAFAALLLEQQSTPHRINEKACDKLTLAELLLAYFEHADRHYRDLDGIATSEIYEVKIVIRSLRELYASTPVTAFGPLCVKAARQKWVNEGRSRTECNRRVSLIKRIFKWAVSEELAPPSVYQAVASVSGLQKGRTTARETAPIGPVDDAVVEATIPFLNRHVRGLVELQRLTGCRPGEASVLKRRDIDTGGTVWLFRPRAEALGIPLPIPGSDSLPWRRGNSQATSRAASARFRLLFLHSNHPVAESLAAGWRSSSVIRRLFWCSAASRSDRSPSGSAIRAR